MGINLTTKKKILSMISHKKKVAIISTPILLYSMVLGSNSPKNMGLEVPPQKVSSQKIEFFLVF